MGRGSTGGPKSWRGIFASLGYPDFTLLWLGQITHAAALWLEQTARPLLILDLTGSAVHLGLVILARTIPSVGFGLIAGVLVDSFNRRLILVVTKVSVMALSIAFVVLIVSGRLEIWHIYAFSFLRGATMAFDQPARRAMIPSIVPRHLIVNAMALSTGSMTAMRIFGASAAGLMIGFWGFEAPFIAIAVAYAFALVFTWMLRVPDHDRSGYQGMRQMGADLVEGWRYAWQSPSIRGVLMVGLGYFMFGMAFMQVFAPLFATQVLDIGNGGFGLLVGTMGVGGLLGALVLAATSPGKNRGKLMLVLLAVFGALLILLSGVTYLPTFQAVILAFAVVFLLGIGQSAFFPLINALLVELAPESMRGRMIALLSLDRAMTAVGGTLAGFLAASIGPQPAQIFFGLGCIATTALMWSSSAIVRQID
ncbi:MAG: MFS transporter [Dehalococcoidia bacterium]|jgi:MFS family permease|nr:MFS transporter [Dehalococcoidia bacterium]